MHTNYLHHTESIKNMIKHYRENEEINALFLIGSVATGTERPDSDLDGIAVVSKDVYEKIAKQNGLEEVIYGKCTYEGGYFNIHYLSREVMEEIALSGSEPMRNMFDKAQVLFCDDDSLIELAHSIPVFQKEEAAKTQLKLYCTMKNFYGYFWLCCKPEGFMRYHIAGAIVYNLYRLILIENEVLFPSVRKLEEYVSRVDNKPEGIIGKCENFMKNIFTATNEDCLSMIEIYEKWTNYDYPKDYDVIMNNFVNPYEVI